MRQDQIVEVRPAHLDDAADIAKVHVASWQAGYRGLVPQDYLDSLDLGAWTERRVLRLGQIDWSRGACYVVAGHNDELAGFTDVGPTRDDDSDSAIVGEIRAIYLAPDAWGKGLGRALMTAGLAQLASCGYREATLWVLESNDRARRFYTASGFEPDGATKLDNSRGFPLHEVRYRRPLDEELANRLLRSANRLRRTGRERTVCREMAASVASAVWTGPSLLPRRTRSCPSFSPEPTSSSRPGQA